MLNASKHNKPGSHRNSSSSQVLEDVTWDRYTFKLPAILPNAATAHPSVKDRFYRGTLEGVSAGHQASSLTKLNVLSSRFEFPHLVHEIDGSMKQLYDNTSGTESNIVVTQNNHVFTFSRPSLRNEQGQEINMPNPGAANLHNAVRRMTRYYSFQLTANAQAAYDGSPQVGAAASLEPFLLNAAIAIPATLITDPLSADNGYEVIPVALTADILRSTTRTLHVLTQLNGGKEPIIGTLSKPAGQFFVSLQPSIFRKDFMEYFNLCRYKLFRELLRSEFLGKSLVDTSYVINELQSFRQNRWDPVTRRFHTNTVEEYYGYFTSSVNLLPYNQIYPVDIAMLFWNGISPDIRQQGEAAEVPYTPPSRPQGQVETNQQADTRLRSVKDAAVRFEKQLENMKTQVNRLRGIYSGRGQANTFMSIPNNGTTIDHQYELENINDNAFLSLDTSVDMPQDFMPTVVAHHAHNQVEDPLLTASVYLSVAEEAMQKATGSAAPPLECWGCIDHPKYHTNRFHRWSDCPNRGDPSVASNAKKGLQQFIDRRKASRNSNNAPNGNGQWRQRGYPNQAMAQMITSIADPRTLPSHRQAFIHYLTNHNANTGTNALQASTSNNGDTNADNEATETSAHPYLALPVRVLAAVKSPPEMNISISQVMPHINIPIGKSTRAATLCCMVDSGAGLSLGRLSYHKSIYKRHPELVHMWLDLKDSTNMEEFTIGGIDSKGVPTKVTSMISYLTPFTINGQSVHIQFALAEDVASNAIVGLPFLRSTNSSVLFEHDTMVAQKLGHTFKVFYQVPHQSEVAPITSDGATAAFPATIITPPQVAQEMSRNGNLLANTFIALSDKTTQSTCHLAKGLLLSSFDVDDMYSTIEDGDEWFLENDVL